MLDTAPLTVVGDPRLVRRIVEWLEQGRLPIPPGLRISGQVVGEGTLLPSPAAGTLVYATEELACHALPDGSLEVWWLAWPARARVYPDEPAIDLHASGDALAQGGEFFRRYFINVLILALKRAGLYHLHAATARDPAGDDWVLTGDSFCGKSTTSALLARRGWSVGTDDLAFLRRRGQKVDVLAWRGLIALRDGGRQLLNADGGEPIPERGKQGFLPEELGGAWLPAATPRYLLFPELGTGASRLEPISPGEALRRIVPWSFWVLFESWGAEEYLAVLQALARQARAFRLYLTPDLMQRPGALRELLP